MSGDARRTRCGWLRTAWKNNPRCFYCDRKTYLYPQRDGKRMPDNAATLDHYIPRSWENGCNTPNNYRLACRWCNQLKGNMHPHDFIAELEEWGIRPVGLPKGLGPSLTL